MRIWKLAVFGALVIVVMAGAWLRQEIRIDRCLDLGGRWDDAHGHCVFSTQP